MVTFNLPHTNLAKYSVILAIIGNILLDINFTYKYYDMFGKHMKVLYVIEQSYIYFIMALRILFDMVTKKLHHNFKKTSLRKSKVQKEKKYKGKFCMGSSRDRLSFNS